MRLRRCGFYFCMISYGGRSRIASSHRKMGSSLRFLLLGLLFLIAISVTPAKAQVQKPLSVRSGRDISRSTKMIKVAPANENFAVLMSGTPEMQIEMRVLRGQQLILSYYGSVQPDSNYAVLVLSGLKDGNPDLAQMLMLDYYARLNVVRMPKSMEPPATKATYLKEISLDGYDGRQFGLEAYNRKGEWRLYKVGETFYVVAASTSSKRVLSLNRFFDSLTFAKSTGTAVAANVSAPAKTERISLGRWIIILRTFSKQERARAIQKMNALLEQGFDVQIIDTNHYPNLRPGFLALTMGPYQLRQATDLLAKVRMVAPESYIKSGW